MATSCTCSLQAILVVAFAAATGALAATYTVGDNQVWTTIPENPTAYTDWASSRQRFVVGDALVFNFATNFHDVLQVSKADFENCNAQNPLASYINGPATVGLNTSGAYYFICGVGVHCSQLRQRMTLTVAGVASAAPPPTAGRPTVGTPPATTTTPPPTSSTPSVPPATTATPPPTSSTPSAPPSPRPSGAASSNGHGKAAIAAVALTASVAALLL